MICVSVVVEFVWFDDEVSFDIVFDVLEDNELFVVVVFLVWIEFGFENVIWEVYMC